MTTRNEQIKKNVFLAALGLCAVGFIVVLILSGRQTGTGVVKNGDTAPGFRLETIDGKTVSLDAFRGKIVLVHFWASWCPPCVDEMPSLEELYRGFSKKGLVVLAVNEDDNAVDVRRFIQKYTLTLPVLVDKNQTVAHLYGTYKLPETYVLDAEGIVRMKAIGPREWTSADTRKLLEQMLTNQH